MSGIVIEIYLLPPEFTNRCVTTLERIGDEASNVDKKDEAVAAYSAALSLSPSTSTSKTVLVKWARVMLFRGAAHEALNNAIKVCFP